MTTLPIVRRRLVTALACAAVTTLAARPADAQLRKLKDLGKTAVKGAVEGTAEGAAKRAVGDGSTAAKPAAVTFSENLLEITDERIARFIKGFDAEIAARPAADRRHKEAGAAYEAAAKSYEARLADYERKQKEYDKRSEAYQACADRITAKYEKRSQREMAAGEKVKSQVEADLTDDKERKLQAMSDRMKAAQARGDQVAVRAIADSVMREMAGVMSAAAQGTASAQRINANSKEMDAELRTCPARGEEPKRPEMPNSVDSDAGREITDAAAVKASGFTAAQYGLMKERVETYVQYKGRTGSTRYLFTAAELDALAKQLDELGKRPDLVQPSSWYPGKEK